MVNHLVSFPVGLYALREICFSFCYLRLNGRSNSHSPLLSSLGKVEPPLFKVLLEPCKRVFHFAHSRRRAARMAFSSLS